MNPAQPLLVGHILTPEGFVSGQLRHAAGRITAIVPDTAAAPTAQPAGPGPILLPGFIDLHVHGGGGHDSMQGGAAITHIACTHARHGTTALLATTMTAPLDDLRLALAALQAPIARRSAGAARVLGVHLEGPYINPQRLGAQPDFVLPASLAAVQALHQLAPIRVITLAPEMPGHQALIEPLTQAGFRVQIGHSDASYEQGVAALHAGAVGFTHLFNTMSGLHHRAPGLVGAALAHAQHAEIIPDLLHVHPGAIHAALRAIPRLYCVTDSTAAAGMPDGEYRLGRHAVHKCLGGVRLADGTLAGSALTMDQALRNLVAIGLPLAQASLRLSTYAADYVGEPQRGRLAIGAWADVVVLDGRLRLQRVLVEGEEIALDAAT